MKKEVLNELNYCKGALEDELKSASTYQSWFLGWINERKAIIAQMKENGLPTGEYADIISFCELRNHFLCAKMLQMDRYLLSIKKMRPYLGELDENIDAAEIEEIGTQVRFMLISLGLPTPKEVFGEGF